MQPIFPESFIIEPCIHLQSHTWVQLSNPNQLSFQMYFTVNLPSREVTHPTPWEKDHHLQGCVLVRGYVASQESSLFHQLERRSKTLGEIPWNADCFVHRAPYFMAYSTNNSYIIFPHINSSESWLKKYLSSIYHPYFFHCLRLASLWNPLFWPWVDLFSFSVWGSHFQVFSGVLYVHISFPTPISYNWVVCIYNPF